MKVLFIPEFRNNQYQKALADSLSREGVEVYFGTSSYPFPVLKSVKNHWKPDILHIHWLHNFLLASSKGKMILKSFSFIGELLFLRLLGINIVWTVHNIASHEADFRSMELFFSRLIKKFCNKIIVHTTFARSEVIRAYGVKDSSTTVIPHGNYINYYENKINREKARNHFRISKEDLVFLYFGRIRPYKGLPELIDGFKKLNHSQMRLLIVGEPFNNEIAKDVLKKCNNDGRISVILKFIPEDEIQIYMNTADVVVLPYRDILTSGAVILAMSFGKAIIAPAIGCIPDVLDSEGSFLYNPSDEDGLVKAMIKVLDSELDKMGQHNFQLANKLSWKEIGKKTYDVYSECLGI